VNAIKKAEPMRSSEHANEQKFNKVEARNHERFLPEIFINGNRDKRYHHAQENQNRYRKAEFLSKDSSEPPEKYNEVK
jgi:type IV secretory pathway ATPase VirB11/archaellum biosynthesis ATPase